MVKFYKAKALIFILLIAAIGNAQIVDSTTSTTTITVNKTLVKETKTPFFKKKLVRTMIVPTILIGWGLSVMHDNGLYSSLRCSTDVAKLGITPGFSKIDDYLIWAPYAGLVALEVLSSSKNSNSDLVNTSLKIVKSAGLTIAVFELLKHTTKVERPDRDPHDWQRFLSFPSGHTAMAFATATLFHQEFKDRSPIYGIAAYTIASSVGIMRIIHNRHWEADVFVGAGIGILCTNVVYLTHKYRWGRKNKNTVSIMPTYYKGAMGLSFSKRF